MLENVSATYRSSYLISLILKEQEAAVCSRGGETLRLHNSNSRRKVNSWFSRIDCDSQHVIALPQE